MSYLLASNSMKKEIKSHTLKTLPEHFRLRSDSSSFVREGITQQSKETEKQTEEGGQELYVSTKSKPHYF